MEITVDADTCEYLDLYGQEPCYYGEGLVLTGESMSQLGDMRWAGRDGSKCWLVVIFSFNNRGASSLTGSD